MWAVLVAALVPHLYLDRRDTSAFLHRWRPKVVDHAIVSASDVKQYMLARLELERSTRAGGLVRANGDVFIVTHESPNTTVVEATLCTRWRCTIGTVPWQVAMRTRFLDLREWHRTTFPHVELTASLESEAQSVWDGL